MSKKKKLYWYKFYALHGPGHQTRTEEYRYYAHSLTRHERDDEWVNIFRHLSCPVGDTRLLKEPPPDALAKEIAKFKSDIRYARAQLKLLVG